MRFVPYFFISVGLRSPLLPDYIYDAIFMMVSEDQVKQRTGTVPAREIFCHKSANPGGNSSQHRLLGEL